MIDINAESKEARGEKRMRETGAICGDGMCPYIPCRNFPNCNHLEEQMKFERRFKEGVKEMGNPFEDADKEALEKYITKLPKYGTSWQKMAFHALLKRLYDEVFELLNVQEQHSIHQEALDVLNLARMVAERTKGGKG
jgi:hypothetical protein